MTYIKYSELNNNDQILCVIDQHGNKRKIASYENGTFTGEPNVDRSYPAFKIADNKDDDKYIKLSTIFGEIHKQFVDQNNRRTIDQIIAQTKFASEAIDYAVQFDVAIIKNASYHPEIKTKIRQEQQRRNQGTSAMPSPKIPQNLIDHLNKINPIAGESLQQKPSSGSSASSKDADLDKFINYLKEKELDKHTIENLYHHLRDYIYNNNRISPIQDSSLEELAHKNLTKDKKFLELMEACSKEAVKDFNATILSRESEKSSGSENFEPGVEYYRQPTETRKASPQTNPDGPPVLFDANNDDKETKFQEFRNDQSQDPNPKPAGWLERTADALKSKLPKKWLREKKQPTTEGSRNSSSKQVNQNPGEHATSVLFDESASNPEQTKLEERQSTTSQDPNPKPSGRLQRFKDAASAKLPKKWFRGNQKSNNKNNQSPEVPLGRKTTLADLPQGMQRGYSIFELAETSKNDSHLGAPPPKLQPPQSLQAEQTASQSASSSSTEISTRILPEKNDISTSGSHNLSDGTSSDDGSDESELSTVDLGASSDAASALSNPPSSTETSENLSDAFQSVSSDRTNSDDKSELDSAMRTADSSAEPSSSHSFVSGLDRPENDPVYIEMKKLQDKIEEDGSKTHEQATKSYEEFSKSKAKFILDENTIGEEGKYNVATYFDKNNPENKVKYYMDENYDLLFVDSNLGANVITAPAKGDEKQGFFTQGKSNKYLFTLEKDQKEISHSEIPSKGMGRW